MSNEKRLYRHILHGLQHMQPTAHQGHTTTLAMMISGIILGKTAQLSKMRTEVPLPQKNKSIAERMRRWVANPNVQLPVYFHPYAHALLAALATQPLVLALDSSAIGRRCMILLVGVVYHKRLLPLTWVVYKGQKGHAPAATHIAVLQAVLPLLPPEASVILLGDGEYATVDMLVWVTEHTDWEFVVRTAKSIQVYSDGEWVGLGELYLEPDSLLHLPDVQYTQQAYGPVQAICWWAAHEQAPLYLLTNMTLAEEACYWYRYRFRIETLFSDQKTRGFALDKSHLADPARLARLFLATALAYIWIVYLGITCILDGNRPVIDRVGRRDKSMFRLGLDWLKHLLKHDRLLPPLLFKVPFVALSANF